VAPRVHLACFRACKLNQTHFIAFDIYLKSIHTHIVLVQICKKIRKKCETHRYIKSKKLNSGRTIKADAKLATVTKAGSFSMFKYAHACFVFDAHHSQNRKGDADGHSCGLLSWTLSLIMGSQWNSSQVKLIVEIHI